MTIFSRNSRLAMAFGCLGILAGPANAELTGVDYSPHSGDNLITRDSEAGLDWLDVNITAGQTFDQVRAGIWYKRGFRHATKEELQVLFIHAGTPDDSSDTSFTYPAETLALAQLLGPTSVSGSRITVMGFTGTDYFGKPITLHDYPIGTPFSALLGKLDCVPDQLGEAHFTGGHPFSDQSDVNYGSFLVRSSPPVVASDMSPTNDSTPTWSWSSSGGEALFRYKLGSTSTWSAETPATSFTPVEPLEEGRHALYVQEKDADGNWSAAGKNVIVVDTTAPGAPVVRGTSPTASPSWNWDTTYRYKLDDNNLEIGATITTLTEFTPEKNSLPAGRHTLYIQKRDQAGNWSAVAERTIEVLP